MKTATTLVTTLFTLASFPLLAQQPPPASQPNRPATRQNPPGAEPQNSPAASQEAPVIEMSPINGELVSKLDSKTAKTGDSVVVQTKASIKTADRAPRLNASIPSAPVPANKSRMAIPSSAKRLVMILKIASRTWSAVGRTLWPLGTLR